jgi:hypothetical protein
MTGHRPGPPGLDREETLTVLRRLQAAAAVAAVPFTYTHRPTCSTIAHPGLEGGTLPVRVQVLYVLNQQGYIDPPVHLPVSRLRVSSFTLTPQAWHVLAEQR